MHGTPNGAAVPDDADDQTLRFRDHRSLWWAFYPSKAEALEAVNISALDGHADRS